MNTSRLRWLKRLQVSFCRFSSGRPPYTQVSGQWRRACSDSSSTWWWMWEFDPGLPRPPWNETMCGIVLYSWRGLHLWKLSKWTTRMGQFWVLTWDLSWYSCVTVARFPESKLLDKTMGLASKWKMFYWGWPSKLYTSPPRLFWLVWPGFVTFFCKSIVYALSIFYKRSISTGPIAACFYRVFPALTGFKVIRLVCSKD